jgi:hypothetical protein
MYVGSLTAKTHPILQRLTGDNIRIDIREIGWEGVDWTHLALDRDL